MVLNLPINRGVGRTLTLDDIRHYQKIIVALKETDRLMQEIDQAWKP
ncbi:MAG: hypothetical protein QJT81_06300 [Candidatus Thiothrix putei]|uniref:Uncharacterized protein n=1 Tax=Candidatus Thiothrix putei TaxID=3080811 RepID=A0AA95KP74_9GAMM|nr:MAG: hypothetical protein QJT81_06300 [Candidatus Thiothrix putei]